MTKDRNKLSRLHMNIDRIDRPMTSDYISFFVSFFIFIYKFLCLNHSHGCSSLSTHCCQLPFIVLEAKSYCKRKSCPPVVLVCSSFLHFQRYFLSFLWFRILCSHCIYSHFLHSLCLQRTVTVVCRCLCDLIYDIHAICYLSECSIRSV